MKIIIKQYLSALREREELDALIPDLVSQMGLNVYSVPRRGTLQHGVDVAAVGKVENNQEAIYLFSIKSGDLTHEEWDGASKQSLRPSLNEIIDSYIPSRIPKQYDHRPIKICICFGGNIRENVRQSVSGYINSNTNKRVSFEEWNGDMLSELVIKYLFNENIFPETMRFSLRKSLAFLDDSSISNQNFNKLLSLILANTSTNDLVKLRQMSISLWIVTSWCRMQNNLLPSLMASEDILLTSWDLIRKTKVKSKKYKEYEEIFEKLISTYLDIHKEFTKKISIPAKKDRILSAGVYPSSSVSVNLKLYDLVGRLSAYGSWLCWSIRKKRQNEDDTIKEVEDFRLLQKVIKDLIENNSTLYSPLKDSQAIEIGICLFALSLDDNNKTFINFWLYNMIDRIQYSLVMKRYYPCNTEDYDDLHTTVNNINDDEFKKITLASILYPTLVIFSSIHRFEDMVDAIGEIQSHALEHCNMQYFYLGSDSESTIYSKRNHNGYTIINCILDKTFSGTYNSFFCELESHNFINDISCYNRGYWPLIINGCRRNRFPIPLQLLTDEFHDEILSMKEE
ncbi:TPA: hypothetical protein M4185_004601 [Klebsiella variicola]|nr:hypothetical protein [Klebsiella variicola]HDK6365011.1 hypothetical protein [Klebsiella variicola]